MDKLQAQALASQDVAWTAIQQFEKQLESILEHGFESDSDIEIARYAIQLVLSEIIYRQAEAIP